MTSFSTTYFIARSRFRELAVRLGLRQQAYPILARGPQGEELTIDAVWVGPADAHRAVIVSSGLHGVELFLGSAVQTSLLEMHRGGTLARGDVQLVLLHGLNPFGAAWLRRANEDNVDLNRNFLLPGELYQGSPEGYARLDPLFNPRCAPSRGDLFLCRAFVALLRYGLSSLMKIIASGQYEFPRGLMYGGDKPTFEHRLIARHLNDWIRGAKQVIQLDFHTGLGRSGRCELLAIRPSDSPEARWLSQVFGSQLRTLSAARAVKYNPRGDLGRFCQELTSGVEYHYLCAEFGTYPVVRTIQALRAENQAHHWCKPTAPETHRARQQLLEAFSPPNAAWQEKTLRHGLSLVRQAIEAV